MEKVMPQTVVLDSGAMRFDENAISAPRELLFDPAAFAADATPVGEGGRQAAWFVQGDFGAAVLRHYRRGGMVARLSSSSYIWTGEASTRSFSEFDLLCLLYNQDFPVPRPLAAIYWRRGMTYRAALLTQRIAGAQTLAALLHRDLQHKVARVIFDMHEAGVWHADLNVFNILVDANEKVWVIDFDRGRREALLSLARRNSNLFRLRRSLIKVAGTEGLAWWDKLNEAYIRLLQAKEHI